MQREMHTENVAGGRGGGEMRSSKSLGLESNISPLTFKKSRGARALLREGGGPLNAAMLSACATTHTQTNSTILVYTILNGKMGNKVVFYMVRWETRLWSAWIQPLFSIYYYFFNMSIQNRCQLLNKIFPLPPPCSPT